MILIRLQLSSFRGYERLDLGFGPGITAVVGENAAGKTNLVEAIQFLSLARSFRTNDDAVLIQDGKNVAVIDATLSEGALTRNIRIELSKDAKKVYVNGNPIRRLSELSRLVNVIEFSPSDVSLFCGSPSERRSFLDISLSKQSLDYFRLISNYGRLLKQRNAVLKQTAPDLNLLDVLTDQMIEVEEFIVRYRNQYCDSLSHQLPGLLGRLRGAETEAELVYRPFVRGDADSFAKRAKKAYEASRESDLAHKTTSIGVHREDFSLKVHGVDIATHGSQGENRLAVLALKLCPYFLIEDEALKPILVLDDVTSELDAERVKNLMDLLREFQQAFVTTTQLSIEGATYVDVASNKAIRRN